VRPKPRPTFKPLASTTQEKIVAEDLFPPEVRNTEDTEPFPDTAAVPESFQPPPTIHSGGSPAPADEARQARGSGDQGGGPLYLVPDGYIQPHANPSPRIAHSPGLPPPSTVAVPVQGQGTETAISLNVAPSQPPDVGGSGGLPFWPHGHLIAHDAQGLRPQVPPHLPAEHDVSALYHGRLGGFAGENYRHHPAYPPGYFPQGPVSGYWPSWQGHLPMGYMVSPPPPQGYPGPPAPAMGYPGTLPAPPTHGPQHGHPPGFGSGT
jgi:hypothetical protein